MEPLMIIKYRGKQYWYFQVRDSKGTAHEFIFTEAQYREAQERAEYIHSKPMKDYEIFEVL